MHFRSLRLSPDDPGHFRLLDSRYYPPVLSTDRITLYACGTETSRLYVYRGGEKGPQGSGTKT
eukprot:6404770-Prymnesium_polylepis.1